MNHVVAPESFSHRIQIMTIGRQRLGRYWYTRKITQLRKYYTRDENLVANRGKGAVTTKLCVGHWIRNCS